MSGTCIFSTDNIRCTSSSTKSRCSHFAGKQHPRRTGHACARAAFPQKKQGSDSPVGRSLHPPHHPPAAWPTESPDAPHRAQPGHGPGGPAVPSRWGGGNPAAAPRPPAPGAAPAAAALRRPLAPRRQAAPGAGEAAPARPQAGPQRGVQPTAPGGGLPLAVRVPWRLSRQRRGFPPASSGGRREGPAAVGAQTRNPPRRRPANGRPQSGAGAGNLAAFGSRPSPSDLSADGRPAGAKARLSTGGTGDKAGWKPPALWLQFSGDFPSVSPSLTLLLTQPCWGSDFQSWCTSWLRFKSWLKAIKTASVVLSSQGAGLCLAGRGWQGNARACPVSTFVPWVYVKAAWSGRGTGLHPRNLGEKPTC